jgi:hypothetical protein
VQSETDPACDMKLQKPGDYTKLTKVTILSSGFVIKAVKLELHHGRTHGQTPNDGCINSYIIGGYSFENNNALTGRSYCDHTVRKSVSKKTSRFGGRSSPSHKLLCITFAHSLAHCDLNHAEVQLKELIGR